MPRAWGSFGRLALPVLAAGLLVLPDAAPVAATPSAGTATLAISSTTIPYGGSITLRGKVRADKPCRAGREVDLRRRLAGSTAWVTVASKVTEAYGVFSFYRHPPANASYRAFLPQTTIGSAPCDAVHSNPVANAVAAKVTATLAKASVSAGDCTTVNVSVAPSKAGQSVLVQRAGTSGWQTVATRTLGSDSTASAPLCFRWDDIGTVHLRGVWPKQDQANAEGDGVAVALNVVEALWMVQIDHLVSGHAVSVSVVEGGEFLYRRADTVPHAPASNEKLLLSMALLDRFGPGSTITTDAATAASIVRGVIHGNLWVLGHGDPEVGKQKIAALAKAIAQAGVTKVEGRVLGAVSYFSHDWWAQGWKPDFPADEVALPSALTFQQNVVRGTHISDPERRAAAALTEALRSEGVKVTGAPGSGAPPAGLTLVGRVRSSSLQTLLAHQNVDSVNFDAEVLGKLLGVAASGVPGTIAKGAAAVRAWTASHGVTITAHDDSGLSYDDRTTALGIVHLLGVADGAAWGPNLRATLPKPGQGTLEGRLDGVPVRAKTGTLDNISALSGWVHLSRPGAWARFSILSYGFSTDDEKHIEDQIVTTLWHDAH